MKNHLVIVQNAISHLVLNKPIYVSFTVLELSKLLMYEFHYEKMHQWYSDAELCFTDTDSLLYDVQTTDIYADMGQADKIDNFDFSEYAKGGNGYFLFSTVNRKVLGKFKNVLSGRPLLEFIGLRPKCYSLLFFGHGKDNIIIHENIDEKQVCKGIKKSVKKRYLRHTNYKEVVNELSELTVRQNVINSKMHSIGSYHQTKTGLTGFDTKS